MPRTLCSALALCLFAAPLSAETLIVSNPDASGDGSFQAALEAAGASHGASTIVIALDDTRIATDTGLTYQGPSPLTIYGNGLILSSEANVTLFSVTDPGILSLHDMELVGPGGFSLGARGDIEGPAGKGIFLDVAEDADGTIALRLTGVQVRDVAGHGIHISDCTLADECGGGEGGEGDGSVASILVDMYGVEIANVGQGSFDADGLRVDERGIGDITLTGMYVNVARVGADGIELDEGQEGDVTVDLIHANFTENGDYCDPAVLEAFLPDVQEGEFDQGQMAVADLPQPGAGIPDPSCIELDLDTYADGSVEAFEYAIDMDDGLDLDEGGPGDIVASFTIGEMIGNFDEGYDFDEAGPGDIDVVFTGIIGNGNTDDAIKLSEEGPGSVYVTATAIEASSNGGVGVVAEEEDGGDLLMVIVGSATAGNDGGELGIEAVQDDDGEGRVHVIDTEVADGIETDGVTLDAD
ncbi:hypothetical protein [Jannaschia sp. CCS1]|uniref:hypothetical protein n=1 Tax=Jannaschia sp. (strain CCS1) TaxID=290400 RepID=UPI000053AC13|nr:hypothetical protein [Jannaschia sp. CCS1]ABD53698.1 hypothetical protein Jann_0781 [Jannaschia sp. CCS1]